MNKHLRAFALALLGAGALSIAATAQNAPPIPPAPIPGQPAPQTQGPPPSAADQPASNPVCVRLESELTLLSRGDGGRTEQIKHLEDAVAKQQADLDRTQVQAKRRGCETNGFFALFTGQSPECQPLNAQIQQMRDNLDRAISDLERLKSGNNYDQDGQRRALVSQLAQNNCGPQYRAAAASSGPAGFLDALFGGNAVISPGGDGAPSGTFRTVCVRACDGYYFPISYSTVPTRFADDQHACARECPATEVQLYTYRNPGEDINQAVSVGGQAYTELPNAFRYRKEFVAACSCRRPGQSWADALKSADDASTLESGDIVVTDQNAKALSQPPQPKGAAKPPLRPGLRTQDVNATPAAADASAGANASAANGTVRNVGPTFVTGH
jgi:uncharacterized protein DUF2865